MDEKKKRQLTNYGLLLGAILISVFAVLFLIFSLMQLVHGKQKPEYTVTAHLYGRLDSARTCTYKDVIYYSDAQGLHSFSDEKIINAELGGCLLNVYSDKLYLYKPATGEVYSYDGKNTDRLFAVNKQQEHFIVCEGMIITLAEDDHCWINVSYFDLESGKSTALSGSKSRKMYWDEKHSVEFTELGDHIYMTDAKDQSGFFEILDKNKNSPAFVISRDGFYIHKTDGETAFFATAYNTSTGRAVNRYTCDAENKLTLDKVICDETVHEYPRYFFSDEKYSYVYMQYCSTLPKIKFTDKTNDVSECRVIIIDKETMRKLCKVVAPRKVISVDHSRFIAFEKGELLVYDSKTLEKLGGYRPKGVKEGGKYISETCGGYVFVFDGDSGECTDTVRL
jgi:hypothetical protein